MQLRDAELAVAVSVVVSLVLATAAAVAMSTPRESEAGAPIVASEPAESPVAEDDPEDVPEACEPAPLERRAAQVLVVGLPGVTVSSDPMVGEVLDVGVGGVLLTGANVETGTQVARLVGELRARARGPLVVTADEESGRVSTFRELFGPGPSARSLARTRSPAEVRAAAEDLGSDLAALGIDVDLAPVVDLDAGPAYGVIGDRSFSGDPATAGTYALAWARGLAAGGVRPTAKHFPGHGRVTEDTHRQVTRVDVTVEELTATDLRPFAALMDAGVPLVMVDHVVYTDLDLDLPASLAPAAYQLLREMGFDGVAITDSLGMAAVNLRWSFPEATVMAVAAGADAVLTTDGRQARAMRDALVDAVRSGRLDEERLDEAAGRMVALAEGDTEALVCRAVTIPALSLAAG
ncbi:MAG TPA: glycoside hydrolase family 3 N-terminal domain-containing protein [Acidimicrobiales bacterium]|nr:glycoside hydrolase family 3 N-terminal domain-containing protein [Acidimicrobiales bacterium]